MMSGMTDAVWAEVMVRINSARTTGSSSPRNGALLAVCSAHHVEVIDACSHRVLRLIRGHAGMVADVAFSPAERIWPRWSPLPSGGYITLLPDARYKLDGDPGDCLWWGSRATPARASRGQQPLPRSPPAPPGTPPSSQLELFISSAPPGAITLLAPWQPGQASSPGPVTFYASAEPALD
jgi:hypothetical protein